MSNNIVSNELPENIAKDLTVNEQGQIFVSRKGTARLSGVVRETIRNLLSRIERGDQTLPKIFQSFLGHSFEGGDLPDILVSAIIKHFAYQGRETGGYDKLHRLEIDVPEPTSCCYWASNAVNS
jgi:hypothetical protein